MELYRSYIKKQVSISLHHTHVCPLNTFCMYTHTFICILYTHSHVSAYRLTSTQRDIVLEAFRRCPLPLYLRLAVDVARRWASYDVISMTSLPGDMRGLVTTLFERLERHYGTVLVRHALGYITAAKNGLSVTELEVCGCARPASTCMALSCKPSSYLHSL